MSSIDSLLRPTLIIQKERCLRNILFMEHKAKQQNLMLRPHFKTHQSIETGRFFRENNITKITVSSATMAQFFARDGWDDITIAFPVNIREIDAINELSSKINLNVFISDLKVLPFLKSHLKFKTGVFIKINTGYPRAGIEYSNLTDLDTLFLELSKNKFLNFKGFAVHDGHTYQVKNIDEIHNIRENTNSILIKLKHRYEAAFPGIVNSVGDTPSCSISDNFSGIDEIRPGNFVYYDIMQYFLGSCTLEQIAVAVACPVVDVQAAKNRVIIYGGAVHFSKESIVDKNGRQIFGKPVHLFNNGWSNPISDSAVVSLSQEHGVVEMPSEIISKINPGELLGILPIHSCLVANLMKESLII